MQKVLITGTAGFIGYHLAKKLLNHNYMVVGLDSINDYYDINIKYDRLEDTGISRGDITYNKLTRSHKYPNYQFIKLQLEEEEPLEKLFQQENFDIVINLAAQAGVRYSLTHPRAYLKSNITGFLNILECCRHHQIQNLIYASSSSVYGLNKTMPFSVENNVDHPISLYAASKKSNELMAHSYSHLFQLPTIGLRFFTVYGPWGRPDMALFLFTKAIMEGKPIKVFNHGQMQRDFTYVDDIVGGIFRITEGKAPQKDENWDPETADPSSSSAPYRIYNIGNNDSVRLVDFISCIEEATGKKAIKEMLPMQPGDVPKSWANVDALIRDYDYNPNTPIREGVFEFVKWYKEYYD